MQAIIQQAYGSADVLVLRDDLDKPVPKGDEVLLRVHAAGVDRGVWHLMTGLPYLIRLMGFGLRKPRNPVPGVDMAGRVEAVGEHVTHLRPGDEVCGVGKGTFAEYVCTAGEKLVPMPTNLDFERAAALPISGLTALQAVRDEGQVRPGQSVLVIGASGGVGTFAVQIAKAFGAKVTGVCSAAKKDLVRSIGADHVVDYAHEDFADGGQRYDLVIDIAGNRPLSHLRRALAPQGTLVIVGGENGGRWFGGLQRQLLALLLSPFVRQRLRAMFAAVRKEDLQFLRGWVEAGKVMPVVDRTYPLREAASAIRDLQAGRARGKLVLAV